MGLGCTPSHSARQSIMRTSGVSHSARADDRTSDMAVTAFKTDSFFMNVRRLDFSAGVSFENVTIHSNISFFDINHAVLSHLQCKDFQSSLCLIFLGLLELRVEVHPLQNESDIMDL